MRTLIAILLGMVSPLVAAPSQADAAAERLAWLRKQSEGITKQDSEQKVISILGKPLASHTSKRRRDVTRTLTYLYYTDDSVHRSFSVSFDQPRGCVVSPLEISREELRKTPLLVATGIVETVSPGYPEKGGDGFLCNVAFLYAGHTLTTGVAVANKARVKGVPEAGGTIRVEHRSADLNFIFIHASSLYLESITFSGKTDNSTIRRMNEPAR